jgi:ATP-dependent helicase/nuclease subunit B
MRLASIPPGVPFLDALAARWRESVPDPGRGLILLPTRRAARALAEAFLRASNGSPMLLPRIAAFGALDEAPLALAGALDLPPPVEKMQRLAALARLVLALPAEHGGAGSADRAWRLAAALAELMDEAEWAEIDLATTLDGAADAAFAEHWQVTLRFLRIVTLAWPEWLAEQELMNPVARQVALLRAQARAWQDTPPADPIWVAGTTGALPAIAELLRVVARLPNGLVVLPGLDTAMTDAAWEALDPPHPQAALQQLLAALGARRGDVEAWEGPRTAPKGRAVTLSTALLPAPALGAWRERHGVETSGLFQITPADQQEEALAIALILREAIETPGRRAALITPDRGLAVRVSAELLRWGVVADDSAGEPLAQTPPAVFLRLLARAVAEGLPPVALLALLKHPLAAAGLAPAHCREAARALEIAALRGPRPPAGFAALLRHLDDQREDAQAEARTLVLRLQDCLAPLLRVFAAATVAPAEALAALVAAGEALAETDETPGPKRLWALEEGEALAATLAAALDALPHLPDMPPSALPGLLDAVLEGEVVRSRRALRGRNEAGEHPRVFIWGLLEARLQSVDVAVLGGLAEEVWPPATDPGPWLSRPMRAAIGLRSPEAIVGQAAHDFVMAACCAPVAVLSCPARRGGAPAVPSRWLTRLRAFLDGQGAELAHHPAVYWARAIDLPTEERRLGAPPEPRPPVALRPRRLSVTEIETWLADPYAIYARHVLRLMPLDPLELGADALDYGNLVHRALESFLKNVGAAWPADAERLLAEAMDQALLAAGVRPALAAWWAPRLYRIAEWVAAEEKRRRAIAPPALIVAERKGEWSLDVPGGFKLVGKADRIEVRADGSLAILDYKTGNVPGAREVENGLAPQLPLEAAMAMGGGFGAEFSGAVAELTYWRLSGGPVPGEALTLFNGDPQAVAATAQEAATRLRGLIADFDNPARPYLSQPHPGRVARNDTYDQLARRAEWALGGVEE